MNCPVIDAEEKWPLLTCLPLIHYQWLTPSRVEFLLGGWARSDWIRFPEIQSKDFVGRKTGLWLTGVNKMSEILTTEFHHTSNSYLDLVLLPDRLMWLRDWRAGQCVEGCTKVTDGNSQSTASKGLRNRVPASTSGCVWGCMRLEVNRISLEAHACVCVCVCCPLDVDCGWLYIGEWDREGCYRSGVEDTIKERTVALNLA